MKADAKSHLAGGLIVLLFAAVVGAVLLWLGIHPLAVVCAVAGVASGAAVEGTQAHDNRLAAARGEPPVHEVSGRDLVNSALPCLVAAVAIQVALKLAG